MRQKTIMEINMIKSTQSSLAYLKGVCLLHDGNTTEAVDSFQSKNSLRPYRVIVTFFQELLQIYRKILCWPMF